MTDREEFIAQVQAECARRGLHFEALHAPEKYSDWLAGRVSERSTGFSTPVCFTGLELIQNRSAGTLVPLIAHKLKNAEAIADLGVWEPEP